MARLSYDCFAFAGTPMSVDDVESLLLKRISPIEGRSTVKLAAALGRVLVSDLVAAVDLPQFANSAADGYAIRHSDLTTEGETRFGVTLRLTEGAEPALPVKRGTAVRVFAGTPMPEGADTVFKQEDVINENGVVVVPGGIKRGANTRAAGEEAAKGAVALAAGTRLCHSDLAMAAALGRTHLHVRQRVRVGLFSTGNDAPNVGQPQAKVYFANRPLLKALLENLGARVTNLGTLQNHSTDLASALKSAAAENDLILMSSADSVEDAKYLHPVIEAIGSLNSWHVAVKPGGSVAVGIIPSGNAQSAAFVGLSGSLVAVCVVFARVVRPLLLRLAGANAEPLVAFPVRATFAYRKEKDRREYVRITIARNANGILEASIHPQAGAGIISSVIKTDGLGEMLDDVTFVEPGDDIGFIPYSSLLA